MKVVGLLLSFCLETMSLHILYKGNRSKLLNLYDMQTETLRQSLSPLRIRRPILAWEGSPFTKSFGNLLCSFGSPQLSVPKVKHTSVCACFILWDLNGAQLGGLCPLAVGPPSILICSPDNSY